MYSLYGTHKPTRPTEGLDVIFDIQDVGVDLHLPPTLVLVMEACWSKTSPICSPPTPTVMYWAYLC